MTPNQMGNSMARFEIWQTANKSIENNFNLLVQLSFSRMYSNTGSLCGIQLGSVMPCHVLLLNLMSILCFVTVHAHASDWPKFKFDITFIFIQQYLKILA